MRGSSCALSIITDRPAVSKRRQAVNNKKMEEKKMEPYEGLEMEIILFQDTDIIAGSHDDTTTPWMDESLQIPGIMDPNQIFNPNSF